MNYTVQSTNIYKTGNSVSENIGEPTCNYLSISTKYTQYDEKEITLASLCTDFSKALDEKPHVPLIEKNAEIQNQ